MFILSERQVCEATFFRKVLRSCLDDSVPEERETGITARLSLLRFCDEVWVFGDLPIDGMRAEIKLAHNLNIKEHEIKEVSPTVVSMTRDTPESTALDVPWLGPSKCAGSSPSTRKYEQAYVRAFDRMLQARIDNCKPYKRWRCCHDVMD